MSLVQIVITDDYILAGSDTRVTGQDGNPKDNFNKIMKLNNGVIFGCTASAGDDIKLLEGFCTYSEETGYSVSAKKPEISYTELTNMLTARYQYLYNEHMDPEDERTYSIGCFVCGFNGEKMETMLYGIGSTSQVPEGILIFNKEEKFPFRAISLGNSMHKNNMMHFAGNLLRESMNLTIRQHKNVMQEVADIGARVDDKINNKLCFEKIRIKDVK